MHRQRRWAGRRRAPDQGDRYGLLVSAATVSSRRAATHVRGLLADWSIRSTVVPALTAPPTEGDEQRFDVLVFPEDSAAAYRVLDTTLPDAWRQSR